MNNLRQNFNKGVMMHLACSTDDLRPAMQNIYFKDGFAYASNSQILVRNELTACSTIDEQQLQILDGKLLHYSHYKDILKYNVIEISEEGIEAIKNGQKAFFYFNTTENYVDAEKVINKALNQTSVQTSQFALNIELLARLKKALCTDGNIKFTYKGEGKPLICENLQSDYLNCIGIIMTRLID